MGKFKKYSHILYWILITLVIALTVVILFMPEIVPNNHSIKLLKDKEIAIEQLNSELMSNDSSLTNKQQELINITQQGRYSSMQEQQIRQQLKENDMALHIPSILIELEQRAKGDKLELTIMYDLKQSGGGMNGYVEDPSMDPSMDTSIDSSDIQTDPAETHAIQPIADNSLKQDDNSKIQSIINSLNINNISGLTNTIIPIEVVGEYRNITKYIKYLDEIDYIDPVYVEMESEGKTMTGLIIVNILHY